ncbi:hypothetical protein [Actinomyces urogenitalis]|uniref:hypothetical protein n=1 Tax=Actinomyces urogenitalis TaxID=103621 RepID=UPI00254A54F0|nr:hypothetical protein [Actinomyces urogenitalis]MDK8237933.1 hypothetical protein [Actinomyces urogenitalis]WOO94328.1 hypothetical protein R3I39_06310 [Actinomyces urogenitalis]
MTANNTPTTDTTKDTTNAPEQDAQAPSTPEQDPTPQEAPQAGQERPKGNAEAAKYRVRAREAETALEDLQGRYNALLQSNVEAALPAWMPKAVFNKFETNPTRFLSKDGAVDAKAVQDRATSLAEEIGLPTHSPLKPDPAQSPAAVETGETSWLDVLRRR